MGVLKNIKHEKFCKEYMGGKNQTRAYMKAYPKSEIKSAIANSSRLITQDNVRTRCLEIMQSTTGLRLTDFLTQLKDLTQAQKAVVIDKKLVSIADNPTQLEALKTGFKLLGILGTNQAPTQDNRQLTINISGTDINRLSSIINEMKGLRQQESIIDGEVV